MANETFNDSLFTLPLYHHQVSVRSGAIRDCALLLKKRKNLFPYVLSKISPWI